MTSIIEEIQACEYDLDDLTAELSEDHSEEELEAIKSDIDTLIEVIQALEDSLSTV